jgi:Putative restriction endonuclease
VTTVVPGLENGDHLSRDDFERRYQADKKLTKADLVDGEVFVPSPSRGRRHSKPRMHMIGWLGNYGAWTPGVEGGANGSVRLDNKSEVQPTALLLIVPECGGQADIDEDDFVAGAPELMVEVTTSGVSYELHVKLKAYQRNGVKEYVVWRVEDQAIDWFVLRGNVFVPLPATGVYQSTVFPGLWLDSNAMIAGDLTKVFRVLEHGRCQPEHASFVKQLKRRMQLTKHNEDFFCQNLEAEPDIIVSLAEAREAIAQGKAIPLQEVKKQLSID